MIFLKFPVSPCLYGYRVELGGFIFQNLVPQNKTFLMRVDVLSKEGSRSAEGLTLLPCTQEVLGSNLGRVMRLFNDAVGIWSSDSQTVGRKRWLGVPRIL
jgi:hypothetical protein